MSTDTFSPGDVVIWTEGSTWSRRDVWGKVTRITPKGTVFALPFGQKRDSAKDDIEFRGGRRVRKATQHEIAYRRWANSRPQGTYANVYVGIGYRDCPARVWVEDKDLRSPEVLRAAAAEIVALAEWWEREPKES